MKPPYKFFFGLLAALFISISAHAAEPCITNIWIEPAGWQDPVGFWTIDDPHIPGVVSDVSGLHDIPLSALGTFEDCSTGSTFCLHESTLTMPSYPAYQGPCHRTATAVAATIHWACTTACDPAQTPHSAVVTVPAGYSGVCFKIFLDPNGACDLIVGCQSYTMCPGQPPSPCKITPPSKAMLASK